MSMGAEAEFYRVDLETYTALRRVVRRLQVEDSLGGEDRRNLAVRMNALLQKAQPENRGSGRPTTGADQTTDSDHWASSSLLKKDVWKHSARA
jgi:hypothetical protein